MSKPFNKFLLKILLLSIFLALSFNIGVNLLNATSIEENIVKNNTNESNFKKINNSSIGKIGVAITTNLGTRYTQKGAVPATIYRDIFSISEIITNQDNANKELIGSNMQSINEYRNILKTNVKQLLASSYDKPKILDAFIEQLEYRFIIGAENLGTLNKQKTIFLNNMTESDGGIETLKLKIESDFTNNNSEESLENINKYLELKQEYYYSRTYIVYINHFLAEYNYLNNYNKLLLDTLINNKDALIKDAFVVIPDSGSELLKNFNLIYTEDEIKQ
ncbi:MAG: hypothetical protein QM490_02585 [Candidatus Gracilibacteria bacterium]